MKIKMKHLTGIALIGISFLMMSSFSEKEYEPTELPQTEFDQYPPFAAQYWVQLLKEPLMDGSNMIFKVRYESDFILPTKLDIYHGKTLAYTIKDDGYYPDEKEGDNIYTTFIIEDISKFKEKVFTLQNNIKAQGYLLQFDGHQGVELIKDDLPTFDFDKFGKHEFVEIFPALLDGINCGQELVKDRSLFITDLSVVEDLFRTYNVVDGTGTIDGAWTFGKLLENMENGSHPDGIRGFLKDLIKSWTEDQVVNGYNVPKRDYVFQMLISPWLSKAYGFPVFVDETNWESEWDNAPSFELKIYAPFKLTAIVNRIDVRATSAYGVQGPFNAGETRFIFTLIDPFTGEIPISPNQSQSMESNGGFFDWRGLNIILEYGNPFETLCELQSFAQQWYDLSDPTLIMGSQADNSTYKIALENVTQQVTNAGVASDKINGSAIHRIRTNEKVFAGGDFDLEIHDFWEQQDWEFRQFELSSSTLSWEMVPVTNNPDHTANHATNIDEDYSNASVNVSNQDILNWIYSGHKHQVIHGNFLMPNEIIGGSSIVRREQTQYFDFQRENFAIAGNFDFFADQSQESKNIRHQISLNTCYGCHAAETKTVFTHVNALAYNEPAGYLGGIPDGAYGNPDPNFYPNGGTSQLQVGGHSTGQGTHGMTFPPQLISQRVFFQAVSPFLTGRRMMEYVPNTSPGVPDSWEDDDESDSNDASTQHLFYVQDQSNNFEFPYVDDQLWGFNDLERRKQHLCNLLNLNCDGAGSGVLHAISEMKMMPLPPGGH